MHIPDSIYLDILLLLLGDNSDRSRNLVKEFMEIADKQANKKEIITEEDDLVTVYRHFIHSVISENIHQEDKTASKILLLKIKTNEIIKSHPVVRDLLTDVLMAEEPISADQIDEYLKRIRNMLIYAELDAVAKQAFAKSRNIGEIQNADDQEEEILKISELFNNAVKSVTRRQNSADGKKAETYIALDDRDSIERALNTFMDRSVRGVVKSGLQGLNKALGKRGGLGLGEAAVFAACSHHFKSGILIKWMIWAIIYNTFVVAPGKKALVYFVSLENEVHQNLLIIFKDVYCQVEKKHADIDQLSSTFIMEWMISYFARFGVKLIIERYTPHEFSYNKFIGRYNHFIDLDYEMVMFDLDYMSEARGVDPGDTMSSQGQIQLIKENYLKFVNHAKGAGYLLVTGHQLTKKAEEVAAGHRNGVKKFNPSMMADSSDVFRIVDALFYMHLENNLDGHKFLTMINRKNRGNMDTPEKDKFFAYPFTEFGIEDDINDIPGYTYDIDSWMPGGGTKDLAPMESSMF